jgi:hypothetical protein
MNKCRLQFGEGQTEMFQTCCLNPLVYQSLILGAGIFAHVEMQTGAMDSRLCGNKGQPQFFAFDKTRMF